MTGREKLYEKTVLGFAAACGFVGCMQDAPPYDDLPLRDALRASPEVVASLSLQSRRELAERMERAAQGEAVATSLPLPEVATIDSLARSADEARENSGQDAVVLGELHVQPSEVVVSVASISDDAANRLPAGPILVRGNPGPETAVFEDAALRGRAGQLLRELARQADTVELVRTTGLPMGAWAHGDTLYVNASWLVAMSALEESAPVTQTPIHFSPKAGKPASQPLSIDFNPYKLPDSIVQCANEVEANCACGASCTHEVTDKSFANAGEECTWVNEAPVNSSALCVLALMSIDAVRACVESSNTCSALPVTSRASALVFVDNTQCMSALDLCLQNGVPRTPSSGSNCNGCNDCDCSGCSNNDTTNDGCSNCSEDCAQCNQDWEDCNQNCKDCNQNCKDTDQNAQNCGKCAVRPHAGRSPLPGPVGPTFWLLAPVAYLLLRSRRRP